MGTNHQTVEPLQSVKRYSSAKNKDVFISQPNVINKYNSYMGEVDHLDWQIQKYRIGIR